jgi:Ca2+-binding RTX toxin-like protein
MSEKSREEVASPERPVGMRFPIRTTLAAGILAAGLAATTGAAQASPSYRISSGTLFVLGTDANDTLALRLQAGNPKKLEIDFGDDGTADRRIKRKYVKRIRIKTFAGDDQVRIDDVNGAIRIPTRIDAGRGDDTLLGGRGNERFYAGPGNDTVDGNQGDDTALLGANDDTFIWDPGDGSDTVEGQSGADKLTFNGANIAENFDVSANGGRVRFFRNVATITMDLNDVERIETNALGGADNMVVNDLSGTDVTAVATDVSGPTDDGAQDTVTVNGSNGDDVATVTGAAGTASVFGLPARIDVTHANATTDDLTIDARGGNDVVEASGLAADAIRLTADGVDGDDVLTGGAGADTLRGQAGDDVLIGGAGNDTLDGGASDNIVIQ